MPMVWYRASAAALFCAASVAGAHAADVTVTDAKIASGKLIVTGTTKTASMSVTLDGQFNVTSEPSKAFIFSLVYLPPDCIVNVGKTGSATTTPAVVANCAARGLNPQGAWNAATQYAANDVVTQLGSVWRALADNKNKSPSSNAAMWEKFVSKGDTGAAGSKGDTGAAGAKGDTGAAGAKGDTGSAGAKGDTGATGATGASGAAGAKGDKGDPGDPGQQGSQGIAGPVGMTWRDTWDSATDYVMNNVVQLQGRSFIAVQDSTNQNPITSSGFWNLVVSGLRPRGAYSGGTTYSLGDVVTLDGSSYMSLSGGNTNHDPASSPTFWSVAASKGDTGATGATGATGSQGAAGAAGAQGAKGDAGAQGVKGDTGATGAAGAAGAKGDKGDKGDTGNTGSAGAQGATGATGATGIVSVKSLDGRATGGFVLQAFSFVGPVVTISVASGQKVTFHASAWMIGSSDFYYGLCKVAGDGSAAVIGTTYKGAHDGSAQVSATGTISGLAAGAYDVGLCGRSVSASFAASTSAFDHTTDGWVMVHN